MLSFRVPTLRGVLSSTFHITCGVVTIGFTLASSAALAVEAPYIENFDSYPTGAMPSEFVIQTSGSGVIPVYSQWNIANDSGTAGVYRNIAYADFVKTSAAVDVSNLAQSDFILSTSFVLNSFGSSTSPLVDIHIGLGALGSGPDFSTSGYSLGYELVDRGNSFSTDGALQFYEAGQVLASLPFTTLPVVTGQPYTMTLIGTYIPKGLLLTGILSNNNGSIFISLTDQTPQNGSYFGYYDSAAGLFYHAAGVDVSYDDFSITVPEPATLAYLAGGFSLLAMLRHRRRKRSDEFSAKADLGIPMF